MARFILVRHGETEWNRLFRYQGQSDIELNEPGVRQAQRVRDRLAREKIDFIYSSDMKRAVKTAEIIAKKQDTAGAICQSTLLREMDFGDFEGLDWEEMKGRYPHLLSDSQSWKNRGPDMRAPNGESISDLVDRMRQFAEGLSGHGQQETVLIVAHGGPLQVLICRLLDIGPEHWWQLRLSNASVTIMETCEQGTAMTLFNDVGHLE